MAVKMNKWDKMAQDFYNKTGRDPMREAFSMPVEKKSSSKKKTAAKKTAKKK